MGFHSPMNPQHKWYVVAPGWLVLVAGIDGFLDKFEIGTSADGALGEFQSGDNYIKQMIIKNKILTPESALLAPVELAYSLWPVSIVLGSYMTGIYR